MAPLHLPLRDVHLPPPLPWWPPAPGWWLLFAAMLLGLAVCAAWGWRRQRRRRRWRHVFDTELASAPLPAQCVAAMSALLRRAARCADPQADRLQGEAWLRFLDGHRGRAFSQGPGASLLEGGFQRAPQVVDLRVVQCLARRRFLELMAGRR